MAWCAGTRFPWAMMDMFMIVTLIRCWIWRPTRFLTLMNLAMRLLFQGKLEPPTTVSAALPEPDPVVAVRLPHYHLSRETRATSNVEIASRTTEIKEKSPEYSGLFLFMIPDSWFLISHSHKSCAHGPREPHYVRFPDLWWDWWFFNLELIFNCYLNGASVRLWHSS